MEYRKFKYKRFWRHFLSVPFIWLPLFSIIFLDLMVSFYQFICFPLYGLEKVKRDEYILVRDRTKLKYLSPIEKVDCMYCGYANGLLLYVKEIAGRTEKYWCGIMHENKPGFKVQEDQLEQGFAPYGDKKTFEDKYGK